MANMTFITNSQNWTIYINAASRLVCYSISLFHFCHSMYAAESSRQYVTKTPFALYYGHDFEGAILVQPADALVAVATQFSNTGTKQSTSIANSRVTTGCSYKEYEKRHSKSTGPIAIY